MGTLVYTLKVKYYNALEAITTALNNYFSAPTATNVTYTKTANQQYNVVTHVSSMSEITNGGLISALLTITNLTKVTLTVGENSTEVTAPTIASDFDAAITWLADQLHWDISFTDPVTVVMKVEAGEASVDYTFSVTCDYDQIATAKALTDAVLATAHDDEYLTLTPSDDGSVAVVFKKPADQMIDTIGFGNLLKTLPHLKSVTFSMQHSSTGGQPVTATIDAPVTDEKLAELKTTLGTILPADDTAVLVLSTTKFYYDNVNIGDGIDRSTTYEASISSSWVADPEVIINDTARYHTLTEGLAAATPGDTVTLQKHVTVSNNQVNATPNSHVITIPDGVIFDGNHKVITADDASWVGTNANHVIGVSNVTATIKNLTVTGNTKTKSGIVCFGQNGNVTLENVVAQNCGNCGVLIAGATAVATNVNTAGNVWGGINVDKSSTDNGTPNFTFNSGALSENAELYTEITDQDVITAPGMEKVQGFGETLKGFIYYTTDVSRLGTITGEGTVYETLADAAAADGEVAVTLSENLTENVSIPAGKSMTIDGAGKTIHGKISCVANGSGETNLTLKNLTLDGTGTGTTYGIISQNQTDNGQMECNLVLENVNITGFASKAIYGTNIKTLTITGGTIADCATGSMDDPNTKGDYAVDLNLVAVQGTVVTIDGVTFSGDLGDKAAIKITQRGGASDAGASDIPKNVGEAHVEKVTIQNCNFSASTTEVDYRIGTDNKTGGDSLNTTGAYAADLINNGEIVVQSAYLVDEPKLTVPAGRDAAKTSGTDIAIVLTPEEQLDAIMASIEGATETSNNVYEVTTDTSVSLSFIDQIVAISGFNNMQVSNGTDTLTYTNDGILEEFKSQVAAWMPTTNESPEVTLTFTVNFAE